jgi:hypothetical protein
VKPVDYAKDKNFEAVVEYLEEQAQLEDIGVSLFSFLRCETSQYNTI